MDTATQDSISERKKAVADAGRQLESKLPGFWGKVVLLFRAGKCGMCEMSETSETFQSETEKQKG